MPENPQPEVIPEMRPPLVAAEQRPPEEVVFHRRHAVTAFWQTVPQLAAALILAVGGAIGGYLFRGTQPSKTVNVSGANAFQGDTLPSIAARNPGRLFSFTQGLGLLVVEEGRPFSYTIDAPDATACMLRSPEASGAATMTTMTIEPGHPWYPRPGRPVVFRADCTDGGRTVGDSVVVVLGSVSGIR